MRKLPVILILFLGLACNKDDDPEKFTSLNGYWIVRTPDNATTVSFRIVVDSNSEQEIDFASVRHNGTDYNSEPIDAAIVVTGPSEIESVTLRTSALVIRFWTATVNSDFTEMTIANASLVIDGNIREFEMLQGTRH